ncbi:MAG: hypothetical protein JSV48_15930, partial [Bradyrhizobium sp.]
LWSTMTGCARRESARSDSAIMAWPRPARSHLRPGATMTSAKVIAGSAFGVTSPVSMVSPWFYTEVTAVASATVPLDPDHEERAIYVVEGEVEIANERYEGPRLLIFRPGDRITVKAVRPTRMMFLGGDALEGPRHVWWNFVSSSKERIEQAKQDWKTGRVAAVPEEHEFIPLPE